MLGVELRSGSSPAVSACTVHAFSCMGRSTPENRSTALGSSEATMLSRSVAASADTSSSGRPVSAASRRISRLKCADPMICDATSRGTLKRLPVSARSARSSASVA